MRWRSPQCSSPPSCHLLFIGMILMGTARALSSGSMDAWFVDEFKKECPGQDLQRALAKANTIIPVGIASGSFIGGLLPYYLGPQVDEAFGLGIYSINLMVMLLAVGVQVLLTSVLVREERPEEGGDAWSGAKKLPQVLSTSVQYGFKNRTILLLLISVAALGFSLMSVETYWQPRLKEILGSEADDVDLRGHRGRVLLGQFHGEPGQHTFVLQT